MDFANYWFSSGAGGGAGYEIDQSLRFDGSAYLSRSLSTTANYTMSVWVKFAKGSNTDGIIGHRSSSSAYKQIFKEGSGYDSIGSDNSGSTYAYSNDKCRDYSAWYHIVCSHSSSAKSRIWINGQEVSYRLQPGSGGTSTSSATYYIGALWNAASPFNGYMAEVQAVESTELPTAFGEYDDNGVWRPIAYSGSYGSSGYYLKFDPSATNGIGHDHSGNGNHFTASGFTTSGSGTDVMSDTPTSNYCTLNPLVVNNSTYLAAAGLSEGNLVANHSTVTYNAFCAGTFKLPSSGKWYWEVKQNAAPTSVYMGIGRTPWNPTTDSGVPNGMYAYKFDGDKIKLGTSSSYGSSWTNGDIIGVAVDMDNTTISFYKNGTSQGNAFTDIDTDYDYVPMTYANDPNRNIWIYNFGQRAFEYTVPSGYKALNTSNLPAPDIADRSKYFDTVLWTGDGTANRAFTNVLDFQPNFSWVKSRSNAENHVLQDSVRGLTGTNGLQLNSNNTNTEGDNGNGDVGAYTSSGFTLSDGTSGSYPRSGVNQSSYTYVGWFWKAGTAGGSSNTDGSITSTVSANPTAGFSIVTWTGTGSDGSYGHGLGVKPAMIIHKRRNSTSDWHVWHQGLPTASPTNDVIYLNLTNAQNSGNNNLFRQDPTSTLIYTGTAGSHNASGGTYVDYVFAEVEGYSKFGSFVGNGSDDGVFIYLGFKPKWLLLKSASGFADDWVLMDVDRSPYNVMNDQLTSNQSGAEVSNSTETNMDFLSSGIKLRDSNGKINYSGATYIYAAFAENPFGGSGVSPATAR